jgi:hypothetical protein
MFAEMSSYHYPATTRGLHGQWPKPHTDKEVCFGTLRAFGLKTLYHGDNQAILGVTRSSTNVGAPVPDLPGPSLATSRRRVAERVPEATLRRTYPSELRARETTRFKKILRTSSTDIHSRIIENQASNTSHYYRRPGIVYGMDPPCPDDALRSSYDRVTISGLEKPHDPMRENVRALVGRRRQYGMQSRFAGGSTTPARGSGPTEPEDWKGAELGGEGGMWKIDYRTGGTPTSSKPLL